MRFRLQILGVMSAGNANRNALMALWWCLAMCFSFFFISMGIINKAFSNTLVLILVYSIYATLPKKEMNERCCRQWTLHFVLYASC